MIATPFATNLMADFGAEIIKTEMPSTGDPARQLGPFTAEGQSVYLSRLSGGSYARTGSSILYKFAALSWRMRRML